MRNQKLRQKKIERNKKRRENKKKGLKKIYFLKDSKKRMIKKIRQKSHFQDFLNKIEKKDNEKCHNSPETISPTTPTPQSANIPMGAQ